MGGFVITEPWMTEEGLPDKGVLTLTYYSGEGEGKKGCSPHVQTRHALLALTLTSEADYLCGGEEGRAAAAAAAAVGDGVVSASAGAAAPSAAAEHMRQYWPKWYYIVPHPMWGKGNK